MNSLLASGNPHVSDQGNTRHYYEYMSHGSINSGKISRHKKKKME
jgi:hypothetical protein